MAREGLRTLVVGKKVLSEDQLSIFNVSLTTESFECMCIWHYNVLATYVAFLTDTLTIFSTCTQHHYKQAQLSVTDREVQSASVIDSLEENLELLCVTGVEDKLQVMSACIIQKIM